MTLPLWIIRRMCYTDSVRLPKRPERVRAYTSNYTMPWGGRTTPSKVVDFGDFAMSGARLLNGRVNPGNLSNEEYEIWVGYPYHSATGAMCRFCRRTAIGKDGRKAHLAESQVDCARMIKQIGKLLCKDAKCVVCGARAKKSMWGFPLCSLACVANWKFEIVEHKAFTEARNLLLTRLGGKQ